MSLFDRARIFAFRPPDGRAGNGKRNPMLNKLSLLLTAIALAAVVAGTNTAAAQSSDLAPVSISPMKTAGFEYRQGAFYYGSDCGGNSAMEARSRVKAAPGLILGGATGARIGGDMNCDDRRQAMGVYRDGLEGPLGQSHDWHNGNGGGNGSMTPVRQYMRDGFSCRDFQEETLVGLRLVPRSGTACRQSDGNWHTL